MNTSQLTATISAQTYHDLVTTFELNNQDDMDSFIAYAIKAQLTESKELASIDEYYGVTAWIL